MTSTFRPLQKFTYLHVAIPYQITNPSFSAMMQSNELMRTVHACSDDFNGTMAELVSESALPTSWYLFAETSSSLEKIAIVYH